MTAPLTAERRREIEAFAAAMDDAAIFDAPAEWPGASMLRDAIAEIDRLQARWIKITEGPDEAEAPWDGKPVLICTDHNWTSRIHRAIWTDAVHGKGIHGWAIEDCKFGPYPLRGYMNVTHWMPLPEPPEAE